MGQPQPAAANERYNWFMKPGYKRNSERRPSDRVRFFSKVKANPNQCWEWLGGKNKGGYGQFMIRGTQVGAHQFAYELAFGAIPEGKFILHRCDVRRCVNPEHLYAGTNSDNARDREQRGRRAIPIGMQHANSKITDDDVRQMRKLAAEGFSTANVGRRFGVSKQLVSLIVRRIRWGHVE